jgi:NADH pyrophosphatase NudC (nudix superfamily)
LRTPWSISRDFRFCPHCGYSLDEQAHKLKRLTN